MRIRLTDYKNAIPGMIQRLERKPPEDVCKFITEYACATYIPLIVLCYYMKFLQGENEQVNEMIERLMTFYKYTEVLGYEELS